VGARGTAQAYESKDGVVKRPLRPGFLRREPEKRVLHWVVRESLESFLAELRAEDPDGYGLPGFVEQEFRRFLDCGVAVRGFVRLICGSCGQEMVVGFFRKTFATEIFNCAYGGRRRVVAIVSERAKVVEILKALGLPAEAPKLARARGPPRQEELFEQPSGELTADPVYPDC
jgi:hypothetical protein